VSLIGFHHAAGGGTGFHGVDPKTGESLEPAYSSANPQDVDEAAHLAARAAPIFGALAGSVRAGFLRRIAEGIESNGAEIVARAQREAGLPQGRLQGELARTCNQLRLFAQVVEEGSWVDARIDRPDPARKPQPRPDVRSMLVPLGPVAIFGASNFPLAFSVAGGDTASALAAGNPVLVKAHPAHPGTSELVGLAIRESVKACGLPEGVFSLLFDAHIDVGRQLVMHPAVKAVGFTGSAGGGKALMKLAASRPEPIPCYAEMGSVNPLFVLPGAMKSRASAIAHGLQASFTLGSGQFCTKPGVVFVPESSETGVFEGEIEQRTREMQPQMMLTRGIADKYAAAVQERAKGTNASVLATSATEGGGRNCAQPVSVFRTGIKSFLEQPELSDEVFGPTTLLVHYTRREELLAAAAAMEGHLTATIHGSDEDLVEYRDLIAILQAKVGRLVFNGYPTGVEVGHAIVHGGPFPATSDGRSTSVGSRAIFRFARPFCYQDFPDAALPAELQNRNPLGILRMVDGAFTKEPITI
jgi:alpha-ketoglutaric semialdehyde dehydrogenase